MDMTINSKIIADALQSNGYSNDEQEYFRETLHHFFSAEQLQQLLEMIRNKLPFKDIFFLRIKFLIEYNAKTRPEFSAEEFVVQANKQWDNCTKETGKFKYLAKYRPYFSWGTEGQNEVSPS